MFKGSGASKTGNLQLYHVFKKKFDEEREVESNSELEKDEPQHYLILVN